MLKEIDVLVAEGLQTLNDWRKTGFELPNDVFFNYRDHYVSRNGKIIKLARIG